MPAIGVYLAVGAELARASPAWLRRWRLPIAGILLMYGALAWIQVGYWANPYMFSTRILDVVGDNVDAHVGLVQVFLDAGDIESAERHAEAALASSPGHYQAFTVLGNVYLAKGEYAKAETMFRSALERRKDYLTPRMNLAIALRAQGREEEASAVVAEGITENRVLVPQAPRPPRQATGADPGS
jgi:tetratricopeptide (TPR) repeat protein